MERLRGLILTQANAERVGGRATIVDAHTILLYDCMHWGCHSTDAVLSQFPDVHISVRACRRSLSGFTVVFHRNNHAGRELGWYLVIGFGLACCAFILLRAGWWGGGVVLGPRLYAGL
jgi:hypothetical protein